MVFDSRNDMCKNPVGAIPAGQSIHLKIRVPRYLECSCAVLCIRHDTEKNERRFGMFWCGMDGDDNEWWEADYSDTQKGIYWYRFEIVTNQGTLTITKGKKGFGTIGHGGAAWQQTVYEKTLSPSVLQGGIMYQIFPDRFCGSGKPKSGVPDDRIIHESTDEDVEWRFNGNGKITNNDYYGGDLEGIRLKLPYLKQLNVTCIYLNPIFEAHSNHRYNTADYGKIDPLLGTEEDFVRLCADAKKHKIKIILDGVFSHTGDDSLYFNKNRRYETDGAYNSPDSPYYRWYTFENHPWQYSSWWGFETLPEVNELDRGFLDFICSENGIVRKWLRLGADGWRLDVADELPDKFIEGLYAAAKEENPEAVVLGEVWEDATSKESYGQRRSFLLGGQMDSVMNYPFRDAVLLFASEKSEECSEIIESILENYPPHVINSLMNHIGTHDTERILTVISGAAREGRRREWQAGQRLDDGQLSHGIRLLKLCSLLQYTLPGVPCVYYGDEVGAQGYLDPFNRRFYPWGSENKELLEHYKMLGKLRGNPVFSDGHYQTLCAENGLLVFKRYKEKTCVTIYLNSSNETKKYGGKDIPPLESFVNEAK